MPKLSEKKRKKINEWLTEGNTPEDLADQLIERMSDAEIEKIMREINALNKYLEDN